MNNDQFIHNFCNGAYLNESKRYSNLSVSATFKNELLSYATTISKLIGNSIFIATNTYSSTTAKHLNKVRYASNHLDQIYISTLPQYAHNDKSFITDAFEALLEDYKVLMLNIAKARKPEKYLYDFARVVASFLNLSKLITDTDILKTISEITSTSFEDLIGSEKFKETQERIKIETKKDREAKKEQERIRKLETSLMLEFWLRGDDIHFSISHKLKELPVKLRIKGDKLQTSHGAEVSLAEAQILFNMFKNGSNIVGLKASHFKINEVNDKQIIIGCHKIDIAELERVLV